MGDTNTYTIDWDYEPYQLLDILIEGKPLDLDQLKGQYRMTISHTLEKQFMVVDLNQTPEERKN
jgi:hypothetical protein